MNAFAARLPVMAALAAACLLGGCRSGSQPPVAALRVGTALAARQVLDRALGDTPRSMDPLLGTDVPSQHIMDDLFEGLTAAAADGSIGPGVASSWDTSADGKTWTFHLRTDARWSNGAAVTAGDFVYAWRREVDPATGSAYAQALAPIVNGLPIADGRKAPDTLGVQAVDAHTLVVHLNAPTPYFPDLASQMYLDPEYAPVVEKYGDAWVRPEHMVSNGAFRLVGNVIGNRITLDKNPYYWDAVHVRLTRVNYVILPDVSAQQVRFIAGDVQFTDSFSSTQMAWLRANLGDQVVTSPYLGVYMFAFNFTQPPFKDNRALREALLLALDRRGMSTYLSHGLNPPAYTLMPPLRGYRPQVPQWASGSLEQNDALARQRYREAGYSDRHPLRVELDVPSGGADSRIFFEAVTATWRSVLGADVRVKESEFKVLLQDAVQHKLALFHFAWIGDFADPSNFLQLFSTGNGQNYGGYSNPQFDALFAQAAAQADQAVRMRLLEHAERIINDDAAYIPLYYYSTRHLIKPYVKGWHSNIEDRNLSRYMYLLEHTGR